MKLQTILEPQKSEINIDFNDSLCFLGSCFGENFSKIFSKRKFKTYSNPFGIVFNPVSILDNIETVLTKKKYTSSDLVLNDEIYSCFDFHSDMSALGEDEVLNHINLKISEANKYIVKTNILFLTLGTAWVYEYETNDKQIKIAANCHKFPSNTFKKRLLDIGEIVQKANEVLSKLKKQNENLNIVFTISPVRHLKDGFIENNQSKAILHLAVKEILSTNKNTSYFPAYEYVMDELREYRFFGKDLVHPNDMAIEYVLEKFDKTYIHQNVMNIISKIESLNKSLEHKIKYENTVAHKKFKTSLMNKINDLESLGIDFSKEKARLLA